MELSETQEILVKELLNQGTSESMIQYILEMLYTEEKVKEMNKYLIDNHNQKLTQNQIVSMANKIEHKS